MRCPWASLGRQVSQRQRGRWVGLAAAPLCCSGVAVARVLVPQGIRILQNYYDKFKQIKSTYIIYRAAKSPKFGGRHPIFQHHSHPVLLNSRLLAHLGFSLWPNGRLRFVLRCSSVFVSCIYSTKFSLFYLMYGKNARLPVDFVDEAPMLGGTVDEGSPM